jgi:hypothetical protein
MILFQNRAKIVKDTWGKRCDVFYFVSTQEHETLPAYAVNVTEGKESLWAKTRYCSYKTQKKENLDIKIYVYIFW